MTFKYKKIIVDDFCKREDHCWWLFYKKISQLMSFPYEKNIVDDFCIRCQHCYTTKSLLMYFLYERITIAYNSIRKYKPWWLFIRKSYICWLSILRDHRWWFFYMKRSKIEENIAGDFSKRQARRWWLL